MAQNIQIEAANLYRYQTVWLFPEISFNHFHCLTKKNKKNNCFWHSINLRRCCTKQINNEIENSFHRHVSFFKDAYLSFEMRFLIKIVFPLKSTIHIIFKDLNFFKMESMYIFKDYLN